MKFISIGRLVHEAKISFLRFPLCLIAAFVATGCLAFILLSEASADTLFPFINITLAALLGIPLYCGATLLRIHYDIKPTHKVVAAIGITLLLALLYITLPDADAPKHVARSAYFRYAVLNAVAHLMVMLAPHIGRGRSHQFWYYNKMLAVRLAVSLFFSLVLYAGLLAALAFIGALFDFSIHEKVYLTISAGVFGIFNTWFFVAGIPSKEELFNQSFTYPKTLRILSLYILMPMLGLYMIIIYAYSARVMIQWDWPKGSMAYATLSVALLGMFTHLLSYPYSQEAEGSWVRKMLRLHYYLLYPVIALLFVAIGLRIGEYGITLKRYALALTGVWITLVALYFSLGKKDIRFIPLSLGVGLLLMIFGPWNIFAFSERSQVDRIKKMLLEKDLIVGGKVKNEVIWQTSKLPEFYSLNPHTNNALMDDTMRNEMRSALVYLGGYHGFSGIDAMARQNIDSLIALTSGDKKTSFSAKIYMETLGFRYGVKPARKASRNVIYSTRKSGAINVKGYDYMVDIKRYDYTPQNKANRFDIDGLSYRVDYADSAKQELVFISERDTATLALSPLVSRLKKTSNNTSRSDIAVDSMTVSTETRDFELRMEITSIGVDKASPSIAFVNGHLMLKKKP